MLKGDRATAEVVKETLRLYDLRPHLIGEEAEDRLEEMRQLRQQAEQLVARRQAHDLLEMLEEWRCRKTCREYWPLSFAEEVEDD